MGLVVAKRLVVVVQCCLALICVEYLVFGLWLLVFGCLLAGVAVGFVCGCCFVWWCGSFWVCGCML